MKLKRQLFRPGRRIEQIGRIGAHSFFTRNRGGTRAVAPAVTNRRPLLARISENLGALFSIVVSAVLVVAIVALLVAFARDMRRDAFELDAFSAPARVVERGYTSSAIAEAIGDEIRTIQSEAFTLQARRELEVSAALPDIQVAGGGLSMRAIVRYARRLFDLPDNRISGEVLQDGSTLRLALRIREGARTQLAVVERADGDVDQLLRDGARAIVRIADPHTLAVYLYGREAKSGRFVQTRSAIEQLIAHGRPSERAGAYGMLGNIERREGRADRALDAYRRYAELDPVSGTPPLVGQLVRMGRDDEALSIARGLASHASSADDWMALASMMSALGRFGDELDYARRALAADPKGAETHNTVAGALIDLHRPSEAAVFARRGLKLNPNDRDLPSTLAWTLVKSGHAGEALDVCNAELVAWPGDLWCHEMRGLAYASLGRNDEAIAELRYAQENGNASPHLAAEFGNVLLATERFDDALAQYEQALATNPRHPGANIGWARVQLARGHPDDAARRLAATMPYDPDDAALLREWARALDAIGRGDDAKAKRDEAARIDERLRTPLKLD